MTRLRFFLFDLKRAVSEPLFLLSVFLGTLSLFVPFIIVFSEGSPAAGLFRTAQSAVFPFAAPLLCALPYCGMLGLERDTGYKTLMLLKMCRPGYSTERFFSAGVSGSLSLLIPQLLLFTAVLLFDPIENNYLGIIIGILLSALFGFACSAFAYSLMFFNSKRYIPLVFPQIIYMLCTYAFPHLKLEKYYPPLAVSPWLMGSADYAGIIAVSAVLTVVSAVLSISGAFCFDIGGEKL